MKSEISRRTFMKGAALSAAGAAMASMPVFAEEAPVEAKPEIEISETVETDIVVVGGGSGGLCAAIQARQLGASVIVLEKLGMTGGTSSYAEGCFAINSHFQKDAGVEYTTREVLDKVMEYHCWMADAMLTKRFFDASGETIDWLESIGARFMDAETLGPSLRTWHTYEGMGPQFTQTLYNAAVDAGAEVLTETPVRKLLVEDGKVCGVVAERDDGSFLQVNAKAVILNTGGYTDNPDMINEFTMHKYDDLTVMGSPERTGDGIRMALELGADTHVIGTMMMCGGAIKGMTATSHLNVCAGRQPMLWVNEHGQRFANEGIVSNFSYTGNAMGLQKAVYQIIDGHTMDIITKEGCFNGRGVYVRTGEPLTEFFTELEAEQAAGNPYIFVEDSLEELAAAIGMDYDTLQATIDVYNAYCEAGEDLDYGKNPKFLQKVEVGPFYAFKLAKAVYCTVGGLKVNTDNQVMREDGSVIEGLYAVGCDAGGLYGASYDVGIAAGSQQGWSINGGRFAAQHAVATYVG